MTISIVELKNVGVKFYLRRAERSSLRYALSKLFGVKAKNHSKTFYSPEFWAIKNVSFTIKKGESVAVIGKNGAGKSTLLRVIAGIYSPDEGEISVNGKVGLLQLGVGFHPELSGRDNIYISGSILGLTKNQIDSMYDDILEFSELGEFIDVPIKLYSSGMVSRLGFSISMNLKPDILLIDEVLAVGDEDFKSKSKEKIIDLTNEGRTIVMVSHNMKEIELMCQRTILLDKGKVIFDGPSLEAKAVFREKLARRKRRQVLREIG